jgi:hypothetical protein
MSAAGMSIEDLQIRKKLLLDELAGTATELLQRNVNEGAMDIHHPERSQGWKPYRHLEYPKMMYHPVHRDPRIEEQRLSVRRRNEANPNLAPLDLPAPEPLKMKVQTKEEEASAREAGFVKSPPVIKTDETGAVKLDPLAASLGKPSMSLTVEEIVALNTMGKDELVKVAKESYGVELAPDATKIQIITAIQSR